ncbi:MAG: flagellar biosynthetic protein FliR [Deltaproteobacteria bacterium]|nr:flagellar biosynthetic protein FliR [Deltaproteobacteria bacterium]
MNEFEKFLLGHWTEVVPFLLVLSRTSAVVIGAPFWGGTSSPKIVRVVIAVGLSVAIYPFAPSPTVVGSAAPSLVSLLMAVGQEALIGLAIGWTAQLLFAGMRLAGQLIELKMGIGLTQLVDPHEGGQTSLLPVLLDLLASLVFLAINGHHLLIRALVSSYHVFPLAQESQSAQSALASHGVADVLRFLVLSVGGLFPIALRVSAPMLIGLLLADVVLGVMTRTAPQLNLFAVILPAQFLLGLVLLFLTIPFLVWFCVDQLSASSFQFPALFPAGK